MHAQNSHVSEEHVTWLTVASIVHAKADLKAHSATVRTFSNNDNNNNHNYNYD